MQSIKDRAVDYTANGLYPARDRRIPVQGQVRARTTRLANAHETEFRELLYPWHPWYGLRVSVYAAVEKSGGVIFRCNLTGSDADRWLEIPAWMFDRSACAEAHMAADARTDLAALTALAEVGAVAAREVSRFARNSRDRQQLIEMCRVVDTVLIDQETIYAPRHGNDRLLLGLKGSLNEYELDLLRQRSLSKKAKTKQSSASIVR